MTKQTRAIPNGEYTWGKVILAIGAPKAFQPHGLCLEGDCWHAGHHRLVQAKVKAPDGQELKATGVLG